MKFLVLLLLLALLLAGCSIFQELNFTRSKPKKENLIGVWTPNKKTLHDIRTRGHYPEAMPEIFLRADGTFSIRNMPDWWKNGFGESGGKLDSLDGHWDFFKDGNGIWTIWEISLETSKGLKFLNVYSQKPPYSIFIYVGDPDSGDAMIFDRTGLVFND